MRIGQYNCAYTWQQEAKDFVRETLSPTPITVVSPPLGTSVPVHQRHAHLK